MITSSCKIKNALRTRRHLSIRKNLSGSAERPRLVVFRSLRNIYAQIIDDTKGVTLVSMSTIAKDSGSLEGMKKTAQSFEVGVKLGEKALAAGITKVAFDRAGYKYHGRVKALADGARKAGLEF
ncbi:MAG TPA: 50S ribosomal protein L18 [Candidatus Cloacimonas sp.]|jgi:large subunit ribosomal protein L18|nr:50S ribosomal protein L18 [Candidatus Cloacimonas sp.]HNX03089.1 50S ribosomal protein L18 [Candidatus Cloacimonas sp.]HPS60891.1 50S ribosomal protein L18 [Candidatus Cloacimonas sp.]